jgi:glycosyl hydrolase family 42 (putative beta-galactosidase)
VTALPWRHHPRRALVVLALLCALLAAAGCRAEARPAAGPLWGLVGPYDQVNLAELRQQGVEVVLLEMSWAAAQPRERYFDERYLAVVRAQRDHFHAAGLKIVLNFGLHHAPDWVLARPDALFTDQNGTRYLKDDVADLVFATQLRPLAEAYTQKVFAELGTDFYAVRVGGGPKGELGYPGMPGTQRYLPNYLAFSAAASAGNPVPGWRPCRPSPHQEAQRFLDWYLESLVDFQQWQIDTVRRFYPGAIAVLYPSLGVGAGDIAAAVADNLCGNTDAQRGGDLQRGYDHSRQIAALPAHGVAVWATWTDNPTALQRLATLAQARHLALMGENSGEDTASAMRRSVADARRLQLLAFLWVRAPEAYCFCKGYASINDYVKAFTDDA